VNTRWLPVTYRWARRIAVAVVGGTVLLIGIALLVLPGPAFVVIPVGLAILGAEFAWARQWLRRVRSGATDLVNAINNTKSR
jgi:tellurite resistance protein TerC